MRFTIWTTTVTLLGLALAAPTDIEKRNVTNVAYDLTCNGDDLSSDNMGDVLWFLNTQPTNGRVGCNWSGSHLTYSCRVGKCVYVSLRSLTREYQDDTWWGIHWIAQKIADECGNRGGSGPSAGNGNLIVHLAGSWV